ncbi:transposase-like protein [Colletotrichum plurivorum]|uniref:Transposase-like protein n=1 Tax=Colletotrichum plurivorum TaxID=2175906 RepID=A0A8H6JKY3_9PEZI|nr:transposase-like protein [Colletotrichum plurivorum]
MLRRALLKRIQIDGFVLNDKTLGSPAARLPDEDILTNEDWNILTELKSILGPLYRQTKRCEGWGKGDGHGRLWEVLAGMEYLLDRLEEWKSLLDEHTDEVIDLTASQLSQSQDRCSTRASRASGHAVQSSAATNLHSIPAHVRVNYGPSERLAYLRELHGGEFDSRGYLRLSVTNAWQVLNKYYTKLGDSPLYAASVILHPGRGLPWLERRWDTPESRTWVLEAKEGLYQYWQQWYAERPMPTSPSTRKTPPPGLFTSIAATPREEDSEYRQWLNNRAQVVATNEASELDRYYRQSIAQPVDDPVQWWISHRKTFPNLSRLALDILAVPAMATDCERAFSLAKLTLTSQRLSMRPQTLEETQCLDAGG